jgi:hypothetical protein
MYSVLITTPPTIDSPGSTHSPDHRLHQLFQRNLRVVAQPRVGRRGLDDGASGGDEPVETFAFGELADGAGVWSAGADHGDDGEVGADRLQVRLGVEGEHPGLIELDAGFEEAFGRAGEDDAGVDEFLAFDFRDDADHGVVIQTAIGHGSPLPESRTGDRAGAGGTRHTRRGVRRRRQTGRGRRAIRLG